MNFHVMQPGSSVATSLMPGEAVPKHVAILSITGRDFKVETIRLKTVRPFVMKEIVLSEQKDIKKLAKVVDNRSKITQHLIAIVDELIEQAKVDWIEAQDATDHDEELEVPLPLIRLRVEYSAPDGGNFDCENPQRFSNRFVGRVANVNDVVQFYRKKAGATKKTQSGADLPEESILAQMDIDSIKVEKLVREFLSAQSLTILPQNSFGDAVSQFVDKDDKHAMEIFVNASLSNQIKHLMDVDQYDDDDIQNAMDQCKSKLEELFAAGHVRKAKKAKLKPKPDSWDTDLDGEWGDQPGALIHSDVEDGEDDDDDDGESVTSTVIAAKGRGKPAAMKATAPAKKGAPAKSGRGRKKVVEEDSEEGDEDVVMVDEDEEAEEELFVKPAAPASRARKPAASKAAPKAVPKAAAAATAKRAPARAAAAKSQSTLNFSQSQPASQASGRGAARGIAVQEVGGDEISDDDDAFAPPPPTARSARSKR